MAEQVAREQRIAAPIEQVWDAITSDGWLAEEVELDLFPGGDASFRSGTDERAGWVEEAVAPERLAFWWTVDGEPASRVELILTPDGDATWLRVVETRPLELLDLVGTPLPRFGGATRYGPALVAA